VSLAPPVVPPGETPAEGVDRLTGEIAYMRSRMRGFVRGFGALWLGTIVVAFFGGQSINDNANRIGTAQQLASAALAKNNAQAVALRSYQIAACKRGNQIRVIQNRSAYDDFLFFTTTSRLIRASLVRVERSSPRHAATQAAKTADGFVTLLEGFAGDKEWGHLVENCPEAVDHPEKYKLPATVKFSTTGQHHKPPYGALHVIDRGKEVE
jgi:hypothetical protein